MSALPYQHTIKDCFVDTIGVSGIDQTVYLSLMGECKSYLDELKQAASDNSIALLNVPFEREDLSEIEATANHIRNTFKTLVVLGTGGSTLNPQALVALSPHQRIVKFIDHIDPHHMKSFIDNLDLSTTAFLAISKSGKTVETLAQFLACVDAMQRHNIPDIGNHIFIINEPSDNPLHQLGEMLGASIFEHRTDVGGRFATFTNVGLLPAAVAGVDIAALRSGAKAVIENAFHTPNNVIQQGASIAYGMIERGMASNVLMPYLKCLEPFSTWCCQIWAESLGKDGKGNTPIRAIGTLDQHSQLQLYLDGPADKFMTIIGRDTRGEGTKLSLPADIASSMPYLHHTYIGDINTAAQQATARTLAEGGCPTRVIELDNIDAYSLGALCMHFTLETLLVAKFLRVNAFDQPAVERGKQLARDILSINK